MMRFSNPVAVPGDRSKDISETSHTDAPTNDARTTHTQIIVPSESSQELPLLSPTQPSWAREVGAAFAVRPSRASSIISTRTRFSTTTIQDDARSVDINLAGQYFHISRDGSRITSEAPPPPYPGPRESEAFYEGSQRRNDNLPNTRARHRSTISLHMTPNTGLTRLTSGLRANILDPSEVDIPSPVDVPQASQRDHLSASAPSGGVQEGNSTSTDVPSRNPSYKSGEETITLADAGRQRRTVSQNDLPDLSTPLRRRNGVRLPSLVTDPPHLRRKDRPSPLSAVITPNLGLTQPQLSQSAGPILSEQEGSDVPRSPTFIGRHATGLFPTPLRSQSVIPTQQLGGANKGSQAVAQPGRDLVEDSTGQDSDEENNISLHYTRMIRFIDRDHRRALQAKDKELAELRERLNEVDTVYRQELKARDFIIDDLKVKLAHKEENMEAALEKARNEVEDVWERRWKDQEFHLREKMQASIDRIRAEQKQSGPGSSGIPGSAGG